MFHTVTAFDYFFGNIGKNEQYFNHPYEEGNTIKLIDDVDLPESISLYSLATQFVALDESKRGRKSAVAREEKGNNDTVGYGDFDFDSMEH